MTYRDYCSKKAVKVCDSDFMGQLGSDVKKLGELYDLLTKAYAEHDGHKVDGLCNEGLGLTKRIAHALQVLVG